MQMKTYYANFEMKLKNLGFSIVKVDHVWKLVDNGEILLENASKGDLLSEIEMTLGEV